MGASIDTYLLEKARIVGHTRGEQSYHIFYQVLHKGSLSATERKKMDIDGRSVVDFAITTAENGKDKSRLCHQGGFDDHAKMFGELRTVSVMHWCYTVLLQNDLYRQLTLQVLSLHRPWIQWVLVGRNKLRSFKLSVVCFIYQI
jgi:hypothetical protein